MNKGIRPTSESPRCLNCMEINNCGYTAKVKRDFPRFKKKVSKILNESSESCPDYQRLILTASNIPNE